jgi:hypothetical protein
MRTTRSTDLCLGMNCPRGSACSMEQGLILDRNLESYFHIYEDDELVKARFVSWVRQASELPGEPLF